MDLRPNECGMRSLKQDEVGRPVQEAGYRKDRLSSHRGHSVAEAVGKINGPFELRDNFGPIPQMSVRQAVTRWTKVTGNYEKTKSMKLLFTSSAGRCDAQLSLHITQGHHLKGRSYWKQRPFERPNPVVLKTFTVNKGTI